MGTELMNKINGTSIALGDAMLKLKSLMRALVDICSEKKERIKKYMLPLSALFFLIQRLLAGTKLSVFVPTGQLCNDYVFVKETFFSPSLY